MAASWNKVQGAQCNAVLRDALRKCAKILGREPKEIRSYVELYIDKGATMVVKVKRL